MIKKALIFFLILILLSLNVLGLELDLTNTFVLSDSNAKYIYSNTDELIGVSISNDTITSQTSTSNITLFKDPSILETYTLYLINLTMVSNIDSYPEVNNWSISTNYETNIITNNNLSIYTIFDNITWTCYNEANTCSFNNLFIFNSTENYTIFSPCEANYDYSANTLNHTLVNHDWIYLSANTTSNQAMGVYFNLYNETNHTINSSYIPLSSTNNVEYNFTNLIEDIYSYDIKYIFEYNNYSMDLLSLELDYTDPIITRLNSIPSNHYDILPLNLSYNLFDKNLYAYNFTCYSPDGSIYYTTQTIGITNTSLNYTETLYFTDLGKNTCIMTVVDDHTINEINFEITKQKKYFFFGEEIININDGDIKITANSPNSDIISLDYIIEKDRITPKIQFKPTTQDVNLIYEIEINDAYADNREHITKIAGHYVILKPNLKESYWVDAESLIENQTLYSEVYNNKIKYHITIPNEELIKNNFTYITRSIGGVNYAEDISEINIEEGYNLTVKGFNDWNGTQVNVSVKVDNGSVIRTFNESDEITFTIGCEETAISVNSTDYYNTQTHYYEGCDGNKELNTTFWQSQYDIHLKNIISSNYINNVTVIINNSGLTKTINSSTGFESLKLNLGNTTLNLSHSNYDPLNKSINLNFGLTTETFYFIPIYNITILREEDGSDFDFTEKTDFYECLNRTDNITQYELQNAANSLLCGGNWSLENSCEDAYDGLSTTYGKPMNNLNATLYLNYTKPSSSTNATYFETRKDFLNIVNYTMSDYLGCWNQANLQFKYESEDIASTTKLYCKNSTDWHLMDTYYNNGYVYYQNIYWGYNATEDIYDTCENVEDMTVVVKTFCDNKVVTNTLSRTQKEIVGIDCDYNYWYIRADYKDISYYRTVIPDKDIFNHNLYMLDLNLDIAVQIILNIKDLTGEYVGSKIKLYKFINDEKEIVIEQQLDVENRVILWLDQNEIYEVYIVKSNGEEIYIGDLLADQASTKQLTIPAIMLAGGGGLNNLDFYYTNIDKNAGTLGWYYKDATSGGPSSITWEVSDKNGVIVYQNSSTTSKEVLFIATGLDEHKDYYSKLIINHNDYGMITENRPVWYATATDFPGFGETDLDGNNNVALIFKLIVAILVPLFILLLFSQSTTEIGMTMSLIMMFIFLQLDWYAYLLGKVPFGSGVMTVLLSVFGILLAFMWLRKSRREE